MMGASYWARWACNGRVSDLPELILPQLLEEGYDLLSHDANRQVFDRGGVMKKIAWSLNGGRWSQAPVDLTITYSYSPTLTIANFYWKLSVRPFPTTAKERAAFEAQIQQQLTRILAGLDEQLLEQPVEAMPEVAQEGASLQACWEHAQISPEGGHLGHDLAATMVPQKRHRRTSLESATMCLDEPIRCGMCHRPAVPVPGASNRYYCLICRHHLPCKQPAA